MGSIYKYEMKQYVKILILWAVCVGGMGMFCVLLFSSMQEEMAGMAESFAAMGAFSEAFGMDRLNIGTLMGFYATEVGTIHELGGALFAAVISMNMLSKEEDGHTSEFLFSLPISRGKVVWTKWCVVMTNLFLFHLLCVGLYGTGFLLLGEGISCREFLLYHGTQFLMNLELAGICFGVSAFFRQNKLGVGMGIVLLLYAFDIVSRITPKLEDLSICSPFAYANASKIFSTGEISTGGIVLGIGILLAAVGIAYVKYTKKDLA